jgi:hypothetical protein
VHVAADFGLAQVLGFSTSGARGVHLGVIRRAPPRRRYPLVPHDVLDAYKPREEGQSDVSEAESQAEPPSSHFLSTGSCVRATARSHVKESLDKVSIVLTEDPLFFEQFSRVAGRLPRIKANLGDRIENRFGERSALCVRGLPVAGIERSACLNEMCLSLGKAVYCQQSLDALDVTHG